MENKYPKIIKSINANDSRVMLAYNRHECVRIDGSRFDRYCGFDFDTSQNWMDTTADYLRNTKIRAESPEHSEMIQKLVFGAGGKWSGLGKVDDVQHKDSEFLFIDNSLFLTYSDLDGDYFIRHNNREVKLPIPPKEEKQMDEWPKVGDECLCFNYEVNMYFKVKVLDARKGSDEFAVASIAKDGCHASLWWGREFKPLPAPEDELADILTEITGYQNRQAVLSGAKAILAGEIKGLTYKPD